MSDIKIHIVYFAYLDTKGKNWANSHPQKLMIQQLNDLKAFGLVERATTINIVFTYPKQNDTNIVAENRADETVTTIKEILPSAQIHRSGGNRHEYPGIRLVWDIATGTPEADRTNTLILYFHAKGITHNPNSGGERIPINQTLTDTVIKPWKDIIERFKRDPSVNKAGYAASGDGFLWYNFWWARASYIAGCEIPIITERRHYYEDWLAKLKDEHPTGPEPGKLSGPGDCLSLCAGGPNAPLGIGMGTFMEKCTPLVGGARIKKTIKNRRKRSRSKRGKRLLYRNGSRSC